MKEDFKLELKAKNSEIATLWKQRDESHEKIRQLEEKLSSTMRELKKQEPLIDQSAYNKRVKGNYYIMLTSFLDMLKFAAEA